MTVKNATEFIVLCENTLGWVPDPTLPLWKARSIAAGRLNKAIAKQPHKLTWHNLELAVELLRRQRQTITSPLYVTFKVDEAVKAALAPAPARPLGELIDAALQQEMSRTDDRASYWIGRLTRAQGNARSDVHAEWQAERGTTS